MGEKYLIRRVRLVQREGMNWCDVFDADTGEQLLNVHRVELDVTGDGALVRITVGASLEYEGDAVIVEGAYGNG